MPSAHPLVPASSVPPFERVPRPPEVDAAPQYNLRILRSLAAYVAERHGTATLERIARDASLAVAELDGRSRWAEGPRVDRFLELARELVDDDDAFVRACVHRMAESFGPMRYVLWATSPATVYQRSRHTYHLIANDGAPEILGSTRTSMKVRFPMKRSRLLCLLSQAQTAELPVLWSLPRAHLVEESCVARGDDACVWRLRWFDAARWLPAFVGLVFGVAAAIGARVVGTAQLTQLLMWAALPALGAALGTIYELRRTHRINRRVGLEIEAAMSELAEQEADARRELLEFVQRQREWTRMLEQDANERSATFQRFVDRMQQGQRERETSLRGYSHDLRNPLAVLVMSVDELRTRNGLDADASEIVKEIGGATERLQRLIGELVSVATSSTASLQLAPQRHETEVVSERLRRRMRALVLGKDIRTSVFRTREAPEAIDVDPLLFDRILDNILTNAAKYTERGSIVIELDGTPSSLVIKVSDTGRGIAPDQMTRAFQPAGGAPTNVHSRSWGVGLSVVVQLLGRIGGRLEVMSKPGVGTTLWLRFPLGHTPSARYPVEKPTEAYDDLLERVVTIRKVISA